MTPASKELYANIESTVRECILSYQDGASAKDPSLISRSLTADCTRKLAPTSFLRTLGVPTDMTFSNELYQQFFERDLKTCAVVNSEFLNLVVDIEKRTCATRTLHVLRFKNGEEMSLEFSWFFDLNEDGTKITKILEFVDTREGLVLEEKNEKLRAEMEE